MQWAVRLRAQLRTTALGVQPLADVTDLRSLVAHCDVHQVPANRTFAVC